MPPVMPPRPLRDNHVGDFDNNPFVDFTGRGDAATGHHGKRG
jgi:hypothetical protein